MIKESVLEQRLVKGAKNLDCFVRKIQFISHNGCPDRLLITPTGYLFWVEMKTAKGRLSTAQRRELELLQRYGQRIYVLTSVGEIDGFLEMLKCYLT
ncbi:VRR-NUC domain-containing protein [Candidatus Liberibacter americanus]|uniref:VRR-NUC domain-containing protein n=1 Tax=Candidatus Liberibacter americanus str. Sao Paulo TaxID=1261131 RepID=U6B811_9HYPH|nr:VRR-NUC domain-containing protein [Candidatus Liberibacter americanus]AHA27996.1 hypothetical protein lam_650 [Candidatus Liberibacter americanus str. Sao Paulo]AHA28036.1 hypothetical protein lam_690 [Candidatus Liberibacter americanus str. Sao Paulo]EMS35787.1 hypothetical protein G653_04866 [Candidatus Liberibacter americanus PW_SP]